MSNGYMIKEIADALELSRNTVAKVLSNKPGVSKKTIKKVHDFIENETPDTTPEEKKAEGSRNIVFTYFSSDTEYLNNVLMGIEAVLKKNGFFLILNIIRDNNMKGVDVPEAVLNGTAAGVISFNIFDHQYWSDIISMGIPSVFIDAMYHPQKFTSKTDIIAPENNGPIYNLTDMLVKKGKKRFGFIGNQYYCYSIYQRWKAIRISLDEHGLELDEKACLYDRKTLPPSQDDYAMMKRKLLTLAELPEVFFCASDLQAILVLHALNEMGVAVPERVSVVGCDNISETVRQNPPITTIDVHSEYLGNLAAERLIKRLEDPGLPFMFSLNQTDVVLRGSTDL